MRDMDKIEILESKEYDDDQGLFPFFDDFPNQLSHGPPVSEGVEGKDEREREHSTG
jgi:hypothetical protein